MLRSGCEIIVSTTYQNVNSELIDMTRECDKEKSESPTETYQNIIQF